MSAPESLDDEGARLFLLAPGPVEASLLVEEDPDGRPTLPSILLTGECTTARIAAAVDGRLASGAPLLRMDTLTYRDAKEEHPAAILVETEPSTAPPPVGLVLAPITPASVQQFEPATLREPLARWLDRQAAGPSARQAPWTRPGWFARASAWMTRALDEAGRPATAPPHFHHLWGLSAVLRAESGEEVTFLKCSAPVFHTEAVLTAAIAASAPELVTPVLSVEPKEGWLLMGDFGSLLLGDQPVAEWGHGLEVHATLQRAWAGRVGPLVDLGAQVRPLEELAEATPGMADNPATAVSLSAEERDAWRAAAPALAAACHRLAELGPPDTLVHGDLHPWNVMRQDGHPRVVDWTDAALGHPFVDLATYVFRTDDVAARRRMRDAYLAHWAGDLAPAALAEAGELALVVGCLYQVDTYRRLLAALDPDDGRELQGADATWLRRALAVPATGIAYLRPQAGGDDG